ncbi:hypothetical protein HGRIS_007889 [Hohenbuehelia grisea]|uniref:GH16 domain-containing protein n=1 Tax=Hohenbuehelia grisea TaxID=104357 RepID=A0ABR3J699_9AGAR
MHPNCLFYITSILALGVTQTAAVHQRQPSKRQDFFDYCSTLLPSPSPRSTQAPGSSTLWLLEDTFEGKTFFDSFDFFNETDPTNGSVQYVDRAHAFNKSLAYVTDNNKIIMKGDNTSWLPNGQFRESVRIQGRNKYHTGLFILDLDKAPWGCGIWPAFWTIGDGRWPCFGEIDIIEGVHDNQHNQVAWHTAPGCTLNTTTNFTGSPVMMNGQPHSDCNGLLPGNAGCGIIEWSRASYGPFFDAQGGGVYAMKWDEDGISVWSFYRAAVPQNIFDGNPNPLTWGNPVARLDSSQCDPLRFFSNHSVIFDITFCGDWAGNSYATSGCPGSCPDRLMDPTNFINATWIINSLKVYRKTVLTGKTSNDAPSLQLYYWPAMTWIGGALLGIGLLFR